MGLFSKIKAAIGFEKKEEDTEFRTVFLKTTEEYFNVSPNLYSITFAQIPTYQDVIKKWDDEKKAAYISYLTSVVHKNQLQFRRGTDAESKEYQMALQTIQNLFKSKMKWSEATTVALYGDFKNNKPDDTHVDMQFWPIAGYFKQIENSFEPTDLPTAVAAILEDIITYKKHKDSYQYNDQVKLEQHIKSYLYVSKATEGTVRPIHFLGEDAFSTFANALIDQQKESDQKLWFQLVALAQKAKGGKPTQKYLNESKVIIDELGADTFKKVTQEWFKFVISLKEIIVPHNQVHYNQTYTYNVIVFLSALNLEAIKGFVWMSSRFYDTATILTLSKLADRCFKKIPEKGPAAAGIGNACLYALYASKGLDGIAQLSRLRLKIKQNNTLTLIEKYIEEAAIKLGISAVEIEDLAVDDFKLKDHQLKYSFDDYTAVLTLTGIGKSTLKWSKPDGKEQKTVPQFLKDNFALKLTKIKAIQKQIDQTTASQKERFDRMLRSNRSMTLDYFREKYERHGLLSFVITKMLFTFSNSKEICLAIYLNNQWVDIENKVIEIDTFTNVQLWHPVNSSANVVQEWRQFLMKNQIQQPFKQAYREIYLLTDAEVNTRTYSNRMASHILKQHQYVTLAKGRNWRARLIGAWDGGDQDTAELLLPEYNLTVEYWVNALNAEDAFNAAGIWNYVTTDQIRFINTTTNELVELVDVPPIAFSEAMRDVDLFVGVASVGNNPNWNDTGGLPIYRDYWQSYSFGDLSEIAKNRKEILQGLIPRLKIASIAHIEDKFLIVKGKIRTYKIHIGSTNILMEPNDQYLCIVPDRSKKELTSTLFLPFEGDSGLSVIISKAFLLAQDDKITDSTIISQINR